MFQETLILKLFTPCNKSNHSNVYLIVEIKVTLYVGTLHNIQHQNVCGWLFIVNCITWRNIFPLRFYSWRSFWEFSFWLYSKFATLLCRTEWLPQLLPMFWWYWTSRENVLWLFTFQSHCIRLWLASKRHKHSTRMWQNV